MRGNPTRSLTAAAGKPVLLSQFEIEALTPFVGNRPLSEIIQTIEAVHPGALARRAVLVPAS